MLQYRENINYYQSRPYNIDQQLTQLNELCRDGITDYELYQRIRAFIYKDLKINELAITRILPDLLQIKTYSNRAFQIICLFVLKNHTSYKDMAAELGCSRQLIYQTLKRYVPKYQWLTTLMKLKGDEDSKNEMNRSIFPPKKTKNYDLFKLLGVDNED